MIINNMRAVIDNKSIVIASTIYIWTARTDKKYMELNGAALNVNIPGVTFF